MQQLCKKGKINTLILSLDIIGFFLLLVGVALIRYARDEIVSILGGFVMAGGITLLSLTRLIAKW